MITIYDGTSFKTVFALETEGETSTPTEDEPTVIEIPAVGGRKTVLGHARCSAVKVAANSTAEVSLSVTIPEDAEDFQAFSPAPVGIRACLYGYVANEDVAVTISGTTATMSIHTTSVYSADANFVYEFQYSYTTAAEE